MGYPGSMGSSPIASTTLDSTPMYNRDLLSLSNITLRVDLPPVLSEGWLSDCAVTRLFKRVSTDLWLQISVESSYCNISMYKKKHLLITIGLKINQ